MSDFNNLEYQGPITSYKPDIGEGFLNFTTNNSKVPTGGYHDLDYLKSMLDKIELETKRIYDYCEATLSKYALFIDPDNDQLKTAHELIYPDDITPNYITFDEYKYLFNVTESNASKYLKSIYETKLRGPKGSNALDVCKIVEIINAEVKRIRSFITDYIGELDETAEIRTVELFQDWTENTAFVIEKIWQAARGQIATKISQSELDQVDSDLSTRYQVLFQTKLNQLNSNIQDLFGQLESNWHTPSEPFYNRTLGPALLFQIKVASRLSDPALPNANTLPILAGEAINTIAGLSSNYNVALSDQMKRNKIFTDYIVKIITNIAQRDSYKEYIGQLEQKGRALNKPFVDSTSIKQSKTVIKSVNLLDQIISSKTNSIAPSHSELVDRLLEDAHPQYLLRSGGTVVGDIELVDGAKIDGVVPSKHRHDGKDGSEKISGNDIEYGSITPDNVSSTATTSIPKNLSVAGQTAVLVPPGLTKVTTEVLFTVENIGNIVGYEFEVTKLQ